MEENRETGIAIIELAVCAPFLVLLLTAMIDIGGLLSQYVIMSDALHSGLRTASTMPNLETGEGFQGLTPGQLGCAGSGSSAFHTQVQQLVEDLIDQRLLWIKADSLCISTGVKRGGAYAGTSEENTAVIGVTARYDGFFPFIDDMQFEVESSGPLL